MNNSNKNNTKVVNINADGKTDKHIYERKIDLENNNDSLVKIYNLVRENSSVLDVGCAIGVLGAKLIQLKNCTVVGLDYNEKSVAEAKKVLTKAYKVDVTSKEDLNVIKDEKFDYIIFADILEHLVEPLEVLKYFKNFLNEGGEIISSIPNIAHGSMRYMLMEGDFAYTEEGLLDKTHLKFFTYKSILELLDEAQLFPLSIDRTEIDIINYLRSYNYEYTYNQTQVDAIESLPEAKTLQFIVNCIPISNDFHRNQLKNKISELEAKADMLSASDKKWIGTPLPELISNLRSEISELKDETHVLAKTQNIIIEDLEEQININSELEKKIDHLYLACANMEMKFVRINNFLPFKLLRSIRKKLLRL